MVIKKEINKISFKIIKISISPSKTEGIPNSKAWLSVWLAIKIEVIAKTETTTPNIDSDK